MRGQCPDYVITLLIRGQNQSLKSLTTKRETRFKLLFLAYIYKEGERIKMGYYLSKCLVRDKAGHCTLETGASVKML